MDNNENIYANVNATPVQENGPVYYQQVSQQQANSQQFNTQQTYNPYQQQAPVGTRCPGKEITGLVLGINSLVWSVLAAMFCWMPFYGLIFGLIYGLFGIGFAIATNILHGKVMEQATITTKKIHTGKKLAKAGLIVGIIAIALSILFFVIWIGAFGAAVMYGSNGSSIFNKL